MQRKARAPLSAATPKPQQGLGDATRLVGRFRLTDNHASKRLASSFSCRIASSSSFRAMVFVPFLMARLQSSGSVRARASKYRPRWDEADPRLRSLQDGQHRHGAAEELESAAVGGKVLMVA